LYTQFEVEKLAIPIGFLGLIVLGATVIWKYQGMEPASEAQLLAAASIDDPKIGTSIPNELSARSGKRDTVVVYLPECSGCTVADPIPAPLPESMKDTIFVKRTEKDIPKQISLENVIIDDSGSIQRALNAFKLPRAYRFERQKIAGIQGLNESMSHFLKE
jgi:hypothetical protein